MNGAADDLPLTGADCFLRAFDHEVRRYNRASHASQLVLRLGPGFDLARFEEALAALVAAQPILRAPIVRRGFAAPLYRVSRADEGTRPVVTVHEREGAPGPIPECFFRRMNERFDGQRGELVRFDVVRYDGGAAGTDLAMTWLHMLFDGAGSEAFMRFFARVADGELRPDELPADDRTVAPGMPDGLGAQERGRRATSWQRWMGTLGAPRPRSLAGPLRRVPQALRYDAATLDAADTEQALERAKSMAGFLTPMLFHLAAAMRAHHAVALARGTDPGAYVVPLPVNLRPKGSEDAIFRTRVSLLWFRVLPEILGDWDALLDALKGQRRDAIKAGHVENGVIAMDYARFAPMRIYTHMARRGFGGELSSFFFAYTGEFAPGMDAFCGAPVGNAFHAPAVPASPGSALAHSLYRGRLTATHVVQDGVLTPDETQLLRTTLLSDLVGSER